MESKRSTDHESSASASSFGDRRLSLDGDDDLLADERETKESSSTDSAMCNELPYSFIQNMCNKNKVVVEQNRNYLLELALNAAHRTDLPLLKYLCEIKIITPNNIAQFFSNNKVTLYLLEQLTPSQPQLDLALCQAIFAGASELVERLIALGAKFATPLHEYAYRGDLAACKTVVAEQYDKKDALGNVAILYACAGGHILILEDNIIQKYFAYFDIFFRFTSRDIMLCQNLWLWAIAAGKGHVIDWLGTHLIDWWEDHMKEHAWYSIPESFPCNYAIKHGDSATFQNAFNRLYRPAAFAADYRIGESINELKELRGDLAGYEDNGVVTGALTAFELAAQYGQVEMLKLEEIKVYRHTVCHPLSKGEQLYPPSIVTAWLLAAFNGHLTVMQELISQDPSLLTNPFDRSASIIFYNFSKHIVKINKESALDLAVRCQHLHIVQWLLSTMTQKGNINHAFQWLMHYFIETNEEAGSSKLSLKQEMYWEMFKLFVGYSPKLENIDPAILSMTRVKALDIAGGNQIAPLVLGLISLNQCHLNDDQGTWQSSQWHQQNKTAAGWDVFYKNLTTLIHYFIKAGKYGIEHLCQITYYICLYLPLAEDSQKKQLLALITPAIKCLKYSSYHLSAQAHFRVSFIIYNHTVSTNKNEILQQALHHASLAAKQLDEEKSTLDLRKEVVSQIALLQRSQLSDITYDETPAEEKIALVFPSLSNQCVIHINADTENQAKLEIAQIKKYLMNSTWNYFYIPTFFTPKIIFKDTNGKTQTVNVPKHVESQWKVILAAESGAKSYFAAKNEIFQIACDTAAHPETFGRFRATQTYYEMFLPENYNLYRQHILDDATIINAAKPIPHTYRAKC